MRLYLITWFLICFSFAQQAGADDIFGAMDGWDQQDKMAVQEHIDAAKKCADEKKLVHPEIGCVPTNPISDIGDSCCIRFFPEPGKCILPGFMNR